MTEQGALSELMAADLYLPSFDGDAGVNSFFFFNTASSWTVLLSETASERIEPKRQGDGRLAEFCIGNTIGSIDSTRPVS